MRTRFALLACLASAAPALALGQSITVSLSSGSDKKINISECSDTTLTFSLTSWTLSGTGTLAADSYYKIYATSDTACPTTLSPGTTSTLLTDYTLTNGNLTGSGPLSKSLSTTLTAIGITCTVGQTLNPLRLCILTSDAAKGSVLTFQASTTIPFDLVRPGTPTSVSTTPGNGALNVSWAAPTTGTTPTSWTATATGVDSIAGRSCDSAVGSTGSCTTSGANSLSCRITGLTNKGCYQVVVTGASDSGNDSAPSAPGTGIPQPVTDFWELYQGEEGHREQGGCSTGSASALALLALAVAVPRLRRRRS